MWIKRFNNGTQIEEDLDKKRTWLTTSLDGITEVFMRHGAERSMGLSNYPEYWHSRTVMMMPIVNKMTPFGIAAAIDNKTFTVERIQGLRDDGKWDTVEWTGDQYIYYVADKAFGKPVKENE
jgi:hypothetical protein